MNRLLIFLLLLSGMAKAQPHVAITPQGKVAYELVMSLRFEEAKILIEQARQTDKDNLFYLYLENYEDFLSAFISEDKALFDQLEKNKSNRLDQLEKLKDSDPFKVYLMGNINLQWAVVRLKYGEYFTAAFEFNRAYRAINQNAEDFPDFFPNQISLGVIHAMVGVVPDQYQWLLQIVNMSGTVDQGREELQRALLASVKSNEYGMLQNEIRFYLGFIDMNLYPNSLQTDDWLLSMQQADTNNLLLKYMTINVLMKTGHNDRALEVLESINPHIPYYPFFFLSYLQGECELRKLDTRKAIVSYLNFIDHFKGRNYIKDAYRKIAWSRLLQADTVGYKQMLAKTILNGQAEVGIDKEAEQEAESNQIPNTLLLKSRLLFDGGYYQEATKVLNAMDNTLLNQEELVEKYYRIARIAHKTGDFQKAKTDYRRTIDMGKYLSEYYAANSALMLGEIFEAEGDTATAILLYKECLDMDFTTYRNSIRGKAKQQLSRLQ